MKVNVTTTKQSIFKRIYFFCSDLFYAIRSSVKYFILKSVIKSNSPAEVEAVLSETIIEKTTNNNRYPSLVDLEKWTYSPVFNKFARQTSHYYTVDPLELHAFINSREFKFLQQNGELSQDLASKLIQLSNRLSVKQAERQTENKKLETQN